MIYSGLDMAQELGINRLTKAGGDATYTGQVKKLVSGIKADLGLLDAFISQTQWDATLSPTGKQLSLAQYFVKYWNDIEKLGGGLIDMATSTIAQVQAKIVVRPFSTGNAMVDFMAQKEIRDLLRANITDSKTARDIRRLYLEKCGDASDPLFVAAVEAGASSLPGCKC